MNRSFLFIITGVLFFLALNCRGGRTNESELVITSENIVIPVPTNGLLAYYPFNGNANDSSGNGNNGISHGVSSATDRFGRNYCAYLFDNNSYVSIPELFPATCAEFTFAAWVKKENVDNSVHSVIYKGVKQGEASISIWPAGNLNFSVNLYIPGSGTDLQNWYHATVTDTLRVNTYYFLVGRYIKGQKIDLSINGTVVATTSIPNLNLLADPARTSSYIGVHANYIDDNTYSHWNGVIDDVMIYNRAISDQEIGNLYKEGGWKEK